MFQKQDIAYIEKQMYLGEEKGASLKQKQKRERERKKSKEGGVHSF